MPRKKGTASQSTSKVCCAVCLDDVKTDDMATCTECKKMAHRYCAGVPMDEFKAADGTYTCLSCLKKLHETKMVDMWDCITALRTEVAELRTALTEALAQKASKTMLDAGAMKNSSETWSTVVSRGSKRKATASKRPPPRRNSPPAVSEPQSVAAQSTEKAQRPKKVVEGKRKVWGTLRATTAIAVRNTIRAITNIDGLDVKRKYHVKKTREVSIGPKSQLSKWWFIISGEEPVLQLLMEKWNAVSYQTNWTLEPVLTFCDTEIATTTGQSDGGGQVHDQHNALAHPLDTATATATMPEEALQQHILDNNPSTDAIMTISPPLGISPPLSPTTGSQ